MSHEIKSGFLLKQLRESIEHLQRCTGDEMHSQDSLLRLSDALKDINEEIEQLRDLMNQKNRHK